MRIGIKAFFLMLAFWGGLAGSILGLLLFVVHRGSYSIPLDLLPFAVGLGAAICAFGWWALNKMNSARLLQLRSEIFHPDGQRLPPPAEKRGDCFCMLAEDLRTAFERWKAAHHGLVTTQEEEIRHTKQRLVEVGRQTAELTAELEENREANALSEGMAALFQQIFEASPLGIAVMTSREGCFSEVNPKFLQLLGYDREEVLNHSDQELRLWGRPHAREQFVRRLANDKVLRGAECELRSKGGELRKVALTMTSVQVHETPCLILSVQDPDERMRVELELLQNQKMEAVGQLAAGMAHDFNNILMIVQGYTSALMSDPGLDQRSSEALRHVSKAADRAAHLTRQLLAFSRKQMMQTRTVEMVELVQGMSSGLQRTLGLEVHLVMDFAPDTPPVEADPSMLQEVIMNLAMNARDAMGEVGEFRVSTSAVRFDQVDPRRRPEARAGDFLCLTVADNGSGIDPGVLGRIFEPFFTTKKVGKGTGLGLATVYGLVKQHKGWIEVESELDEGTTFRVYLPASCRGLPEPAPGQDAELVGRETILLVEDEPGLRALVPTILKRYGYEVLIAASGAEALRLWKENQAQVDLLLTDMAMPEGISGHALAQKLRLDKPNLKVVYTSGYSVDALDQSTWDFVEGVNFLQKPYRPQRLAETVRCCLANKEVAAAH